MTRTVALPRVAPLRPPARMALLLLGGLAGALVLVHGSLGEHAAAQARALLLALGCLVAALSLTGSAARLPRRDARPWRYLAVAGGLLALGQTMAAVRDIGSDVVRAGWEELPQLLAVFAAVAACLVLPPRSSRRGSSRAVVDALVVLVAVAVLGEFVLADAAVAGKGLAPTLITVGYPAMGALLCGLGLVTFARASEPRRPAAAWLVGVVGLMAVVAVADAFGRTIGGPPVDLLTALAWVGMLACAVRAGDADRGEPADEPTPAGPVPLLGVLLSHCTAYSVALLVVGAAVAGRPVTPLEGVGVGVLVLLTFVRGLLWATDGQRLARRLLRTDRRMRALVASAEDVTLVLEPDGLVTWVSGGARKQLGWSARELTGRPLRDLLEAADDVALRRLSADVLAGARVALPTTLRLRTAAGDRRDVEVVGAARVDTGGSSDDSSDDEVVLHLRDVTDRRSTERELERMAWTDYLTGLPNRARLMAALEAARVGTGVGEPACVLLIDLDGFKTVNDVAGHEAGDLLLADVAERLRGAARDRDLVARLGGDEFALVVPGGAEEATALAERLLLLLDRPFRAPAPDPDGGRGRGPVFAVSASIGVAQLVPDEDAAAAIRAADLALRAAKAAGKKCVRFTGPGRHGALDDAMRRRARLARDLPDALQHEQLRLEYQPVAGLAARRVVGVEALVRWDHPVLGTVPPDEFIALAEEDGLIVPLQQWVLRTAAADLAPILAEGRDLKLAVNVSVRHLQAGCLAPDVARALAAAGLPPHQLVLEVTESVLIDAADRVDGDLVTLRDMGCVIALDDFGKGFSSLAYLARMPVDVLKMDAEFMADIEGDTRAAALVRTVVDMGRRLGMDVVGEGVETAGQLTELTALGCGFVQGWLIGRPVPVERLAALIDGFDPAVLDGPDLTGPDPTVPLADVH